MSKIVQASKRWLLIGAGRRIRDDIVPALLSLQVATSHITIVRKRNLIFDNSLNIETYHNIREALKYSNPDVVICCVPNEAAKEVLSHLASLSKPVIILFDTPISKSFPELLALKNVHSVFALEESILIPWLIPLRTLIDKSRFIIFFRAFYEYHGIAALSRLVQFPIIRIWPKSKRWRSLKLFFTDEKKIILFLGYRDYYKALAIFIGTKIQFLSAKKGLELQKEFSQESLQEMIFTRFFNRSRSAKLSRGEAQDRLLFSDLDFWKQFALVVGLEAIADCGEVLFPSIEDMFQFERLNDG